MDLFDLIGPVMIGPSSSHTAGAARIGLIARQLLGEDVLVAHIGFYGSFAKTYHGHGTDRAIVGGLMGMNVDDPSLRKSLEIANESGMKYEFHEVKIRNAHPNTVLLELEGKTGKRLTIEAASVGGGNIEVHKLDGMQVSFTGKQNTLIVHHMDVPGAIATIAHTLAADGLNIATMQDFRTKLGGTATMVSELDGEVGKNTIASLLSLPQVVGAVFLKRRID